MTQVVIGIVFNDSYAVSDTDSLRGVVEALLQADSNERDKIEFFESEDIAYEWAINNEVTFDAVLELDLHTAVVVTRKKITN